MPKIKRRKLSSVGMFLRQMILNFSLTGLFLCAVKNAHKGLLSTDKSLSQVARNQFSFEY